MSKPPNSSTTSTLLDLSGKIEPSVLNAIGAVASETSKLGIPLLLIGAAARDFLLLYGAGVPTARATKDVDLAVLVDSWPTYERLASALASSGRFKRDLNVGHRFASDNGILLDLIPFGNIGGSEHAIFWPPDGVRRMSTLGIDEVFRHSVKVVLRKGPDLVVRVTSLAGLALLKVISWEERYPERGRDAADFFLIVNNYMDAGNLDRLSSDAKDLAEGSSLHLGLLGARLLGRDMARIADPDTAALVGSVLQAEASADGRLRLLGDMRRSVGPSTSDNDLLNLLAEVRRGFDERRENVA